jgi:hypothetical protein
LTDDVFGRGRWRPGSGDPRPDRPSLDDHVDIVLDQASVVGDGPLVPLAQRFRRILPRPADANKPFGARRHRSAKYEVHAGREAHLRQEHGAELAAPSGRCARGGRAAARSFSMVRIHGLILLNRYL